MGREFFKTIFKFFVFLFLALKVILASPDRGVADSRDYQKRLSEIACYKFKSVTAPKLLEETNLAYFASTPLV